MSALGERGPLEASPVGEPQPPRPSTRDDRHRGQSSCHRRAPDAARPLIAVTLDGVSGRAQATRDGRPAWPG